MAGKLDSELEVLTGAYKKLVDEKEGDVKDDDHRSPRSGASHLRVPPPPPPPAPPPPAPPALHEQLQGNGLTTNPTMASTTIKLLPTSAVVRLFSGNHSDYSARKFILQCEDVMICVRSCGQDLLRQITLGVWVSGFKSNALRSLP